jgi:putative PIN family toxin of toxin-antitoxin system
VIRAVFDTNILASGAIAAGGSIALLIDAWQRGRVQVVVSSHILDELKTALEKPDFTKRLDRQFRDRYLLIVHITVTVVAITVPIPNVAVTQADNRVLATAESAGVSYLVTGDVELQQLGRYQAITIISPRLLLELLSLDVDELNDPGE